MSVLLAIALAAQAVPPMTMPMPAQTAPAATGYSTGGTSVGTLLADPAARAVLEKHLPGIASNPNLQMVSGATLRSLQPYAPDKLTDAKLAAIDVDLAKLAPAK